MPTLEVPNAIINYDVQGKGPTLLLIAGARGSGKVFERVVPYLATNFTVITYDRRGHSQSYITGEQDYSQRLERDADDAAELIQHVASTNENKSVFAFGTSSGAIVASALIRRHASLFNKLICHEPPLFKALPEDEANAGLKATQETYELYRKSGTVTALQAFAKNHIAPEELEWLARNANPASDPYVFGNTTYWFERELMAYPFKEVPWEEFAEDQVKKRLIFGYSNTGGHLQAARVARTIGEKLGIDTVQFPGAHLGYLTHPDSFADVLRHVFGI